ncbi:GAF and ANTAR domain-containing protein [Amycolatopsis thermalba]|uniref:GAF and ANTAR domain-containing protein n=1 Tax=Amycolatopsis thermalba TaxID=944492 RepID=A0ABY4NUX3_9PSEU|nr:MULTISPECIES: GAF and ANTAR domain-containing protein [Amycolatopsis]UQS23870.1 GAF and ANTAR domain-containing protein [Amycolatopsis thermalba]
MSETVLSAPEVLSIAQELAEIGRLVDDDDVSATLSRYVARAVALLPGCDRATITARTDVGTAEVLAAAGKPLPEPPTDGSGPDPVTEALTYREPRRLDDTATDRRWPAYGAHLRRHGFGSALTLPLPGTESGAAFSVLSTEPGRFGDGSHDLALLFTLHAGVAFDNSALYHDNIRLLGHVQTALRTRTVIAQAQGLLMRHDDQSADEALAALKRMSQQRNVKLRDVAAALVAAHHAGRLADVLHAR